MARIRSVKPELRTSLTAAEWPREVRYFWVLLWGYLDDYGRGVDEPRLIKADCFPLDDDLTVGDIEKWLEMFAAPRDDEPASICRYTVAGRRYLHVPHWGSHQKPQHPTDSKIPKCPLGKECGKGSREIHETLTNPHEVLSGTVHEASPGSDTGRDAATGSPEAWFDDESGIDAGQDQFMSDSGEARESLSGNGVSNTPSPTSVTTEVDGEVDGTVGGGKTTPAIPAREDVSRLCVHLADRIEGNGSNRPDITVKWQDAARLMLDNDHRTEQQVHDAIDWCQDSEFWRSNILSMPTLRKQYEKLRLQAQAQRGGQSSLSRREQDRHAAAARAMARAQARTQGGSS
jgi:hypothetical protein